MIYDRQAGWLREFLAARCTNEQDVETMGEILLTFKALWLVVRAAIPLVSKPPAHYSPHSRKNKLQDAIKPFLPMDKEPYDGPPRKTHADPDVSGHD